ncbi:hypothetical protein AAY473_004532 [Plecturocebus cupreus]
MEADSTAHSRRHSVWRTPPVFLLCHMCCDCCCSQLGHSVKLPLEVPALYFHFTLWTESIWRISQWLLWKEHLWVEGSRQRASKGVVLTTAALESRDKDDGCSYQIGVCTKYRRTEEGKSVTALRTLQRADLQGGDFGGILPEPQVPSSWADRKDHSGQSCGERWRLQ